MYIKQSRIRKSKKLLNDLEPNQKFFLGIEISDEIKKILNENFKILDLVDKTTIFPSPVYGIMTRRNAIGEFIPQKDQPKEIAYRAQSWEVTDWGGKSHSGISYIPYERYPRKFIEPKELKFIILLNQTNKNILIIDSEYSNSAAYDSDIIFGANLFLEIFGEVNTFVIDNNKILVKGIETVNWEILPPGEKIWTAFSKKQVNSLSVSEQYLINERFEYIKSFNPDVIRQGIGGYTGYLIFEFTQKNLFVFDSIIYGDAMYIFEDNWEEISKLTKKEIIQKGLAKERIIHNEYCKSKLKKHLT